MPEEIIPQNFEGQTISEGDMDRLAEVIETTRETPEMQALDGKSVVKEAIRSFAPQAVVPAVVDEDSNLPKYAAGASGETKAEIEHLLAMAFTEGIEKANKEAMRSNPFVLDAFHDALAGKLYPELQKRKLVD